MATIDNSEGKHVLEVDSVMHLQNGQQGLVFFVEVLNKVNKELNNFDQNSEQISDKNQAPLVPAFAIRYKDEIRVFKNICGHIAVNLDFQPGQFFDEIGEHLVCSTHGALYQADNGKCLGGPCFGVGLEKIEAHEHEGILFITDKNIASVQLKESE